MKNTNNTDNQTILLCNGCYALSGILDYVRYVVQDRIPNLSHDKSYTLREIFGEEEWSYFDPMNKIEAGWSMVHLVARGELPMISANECKHQSPKKYRLK